MARCKTSSPKLTTAERRLKAFELRKLAYTYEQIGTALGISKQSAHSLVVDYLKNVEAKTEEAASEVKQLELLRLDGMLQKALTMANNGDLKAMDRVLRIMIRRSELLGLDAPKRIAPTDPEGNALGGGGGLASLLRDAEKLKSQNDE